MPQMLNLADFSALFATARLVNLSPVHTSNNVEETLSKQQATLLFLLLRQCCRFWQQSRTLLRHCCQKRQQCRSNVRLCRINIRHCSIRQCCFDIVAGLDRALVRPTTVGTMGVTERVARVHPRQLRQLYLLRIFPVLLDNF